MRTLTVGGGVETSLDESYLTRCHGKGQRCRLFVLSAEEADIADAGPKLVLSRRSGSFKRSGGNVTRMASRSSWCARRSLFLVLGAL